MIMKYSHLASVLAVIIEKEGILLADELTEFLEHTEGEIEFHIKETVQP